MDKKEELTKKAADMLDELVKANEETGTIVLTCDKEGATIALNGKEVSIIAAIVYSLNKRDKLGELLHKCINVSALMALDSMKDMVVNIGNNTKKTEDDGTEK